MSALILPKLYWMSTGLLTQGMGIVTSWENLGLTTLWVVAATNAEVPLHPFG
jgi:hypothetical protein